MSDHGLQMSNANRALRAWKNRGGEEAARHQWSRLIGGLGQILRLGTEQSTSIAARVDIPRSWTSVAGVPGVLGS